MLLSAPDRIVIASVGFRLQQKELKTRNENVVNDLHEKFYIGARATNNRTISSFVNRGYTRLRTLFEKVISFLIPISRMVVFTNLTFGL